MRSCVCICVQELCDTDLSRLMDEVLTILGPCLRLSCVLQIATDIAAGLQCMHSMRICHADIKPCNVLIHGQADALPLGCVAVLADFGLSRALPAGQDTIPHILGTPFYVAPETALQGQLSLQSDIYRWVM